MYLKDGYARSTELSGHYRYMTVKEAKKLSYNCTVHCIDKRGNVRTAKVKGAPKIWKKSAGCILSLKYGMYEYFTVGGKDLRECDAIGIVMVPMPILFIIANASIRPTVRSLAEMRSWHREYQGKRLKRFLANEGSVKRIV